MKFLVPNYSCLQNPWLGGYHPRIPVLSVLNWICWTPPEKNSWVRHCWDRWVSLQHAGSPWIISFLLNLKHQCIYHFHWVNPVNNITITLINVKLHMLTFIYSQRYFPSYPHFLQRALLKWCIIFLILCFSLFFSP